MMKRIAPVLLGFLTFITAAGPELFLAAPAQAIVTRHDTGYTRFVASETDYPAIFFLEQRERRKVCVATLIHPRWAITAAHCAEDTPLLASVQAGQEYRVRIAGTEATIDMVQLHPGWQGLEKAASTLGEAEVDLALLRLREPVLTPRPLPVYPEQDELGQFATFLGWGFTGTGLRGIRRDDGQFRFARNTIISAETRLHFVFDDPRQADSPALEFEGIPGLGDSGGPALLNTGSGLAIAGVAVGELVPQHSTAVHSGHEGAAPRRQGKYGAVVVYERLSLHQEWIHSVIADWP